MKLEMKLAVPCSSSFKLLTHLKDWLRIYRIYHIALISNAKLLVKIVPFALICKFLPADSIDAVNPQSLLCI